MCLERVKETYDIPSTMIMDGWKEFNKDSKGTLKFQAQTLNGKSEVPRDVWIQADASNVSANGIKASDGNYYMPGFHVYADEKEFKASITGKTRVFIRSITCRGTDQGKEAIIAQEMFVPSDPNGWPPLPGDEAAPKKKSLLDKLKN